MAIFRPKIYEDHSKEILEGLGFTVISQPLIEARPTGMKPMTKADFIVFTSAEGVRLALEEVAPRELAQAKICAIGPRTAEALERGGVAVDLIPEEYSSEGLVQALEPLAFGKRVEVVRSSAGSALLIAGLNRSGAFVHETTIYSLECLQVEAKVIREILENADVFLFTSSLTVQNLLRRAPDQTEAAQVLNRKLVGAIGRPTQASLQTLGIKAEIIASEATFEKLAREMRESLERDSQDGVV